MKFSTKLCIAALATTAPSRCLPAHSRWRSSTTRSRRGLPDARDGGYATETTAATSTTGRNWWYLRPLKSAHCLTDAVNANDTATIPASSPAASRGQERGTRKFFVASNQTKAALAAKDLAGSAPWVDALAALGAAETPDLVARYTDLASATRMPTKSTKR